MGIVVLYVFGYIGWIIDCDFKWIEEVEKQVDYKGIDYIGKNGLEQCYEFELYGEIGYEQVEIDVGGCVVCSLKWILLVLGNNLQLIFDIKLQEIIEKVFGDCKGFFVVIDLVIGGVFVLVLNFIFDLNFFVDGILLENWKEFNDYFDRLMINWVINGFYLFGLIFKFFMVLVVLEMGKCMFL